MSEHTPSENKEYIKAMRELRRSSASAPHADRRDRRKRTRKSMLDSDINEQREER